MKTAFRAALLLLCVLLPVAAHGSDSPLKPQIRLLNQKLIAAIEKGKPLAVQALLRAGAQANSRDADKSTALQIAVSKGSV